ncbi:hypothetical protein D3C75_1316190 [compost metagenome]
MIIVIDPGKGETGKAFAVRSRELVEQMHAAGQTRLSGDRRYKERARAEREGINMPSEELAQLRALALA